MKKGRCSDCACINRYKREKAWRRKSTQKKREGITKYEYTKINPKS